jgi:nucleotide-binding universal stress UspA family protein
MLKTILVPLSGSKADETAVVTAFQIARPTAAHVEGLFVRADPRDAIPLFGEGVSGVLVEQIMQAAAAEGSTHSATAHALFARLSAAAGAAPAERPPGPGRLSSAYREVTGRAEQTVSVEGRLSDLVVMSRTAAKADAVYAMALETAIVGCGRPILLAADVPRTTIGETVAIAWNGSREAALAVAAAMPMLMTASRVVVLTAETSSTATATGDGLVAHLAWHGIDARLARVAPSGPVGQALMAQAFDVGADLLVMGGYGHSRLREMVLGGVTRWMIDNGGLPVLLVH